ncbi:MAG: tetratricopeptide repeat protein [Anaerolineae bacterium]
MKNLWGVPLRTFGELLSEYMQRTGISDSELARTLGVRRQTIFRWKEGLTSRPRSREDVLSCAQRLRLSPVERDELLIAAGFPPEERLSQGPNVLLGDSRRLRTADHGPETADSGPQNAGSREQPMAEGSSIDQARRPPVGLPAGADGVLGALGADANGGVPPVPILAPPAHAPAVSGPRRSLRRLPSAVILAALVVVLVFVAVLLWTVVGGAGLGPSAKYPVAAPGETLILLGQFTATAPGKPDYDVTDRIQAALEREIHAARLDRVRVVRLSDEVKEGNSAANILVQSHATLIVWGNQANGALSANLLLPPAPITGTSALRSLVTLPNATGLTVDSAMPEELRALALVALAQVYVRQGEVEAARAALTLAMAQPPVAHDAAAVLNLYLGYTNQIASPADLDQAITLYSQAIDLAPDLTSAYLDRGVAYVQQGKTSAWQDDFIRVLTLEPNNVLASRGLCWGFALANQPDQALPHCNNAVLRDTTALSRDARGVVYAELGRAAEAITDFQEFIRWLQTQPPAIRDRYAPTRNAWMQSLQAGKNPIDQPALDKLRAE